MDNYKIEKFKWGCMENSIDCKIGDFQTEGNVIMLHKHLDKSVFVSFFLTHTCNTINKSKLYLLFPHTGVIVNIWMVFLKEIIPANQFNLEHHPQESR